MLKSYENFQTDGAAAMSDTLDAHGLCLQAFAGISAMVSHDLKNTLAIINENAGLLDDLALMAGESASVPSERVQGVAAKIAQQVVRSNTIIKNLNRFAHSGDAPVARAALGELLELMAALTARKAAMRNLTVSVECDPGHQVELAVFQLEALVYLILLVLYSKAAAGSTITVGSRQISDGMVLCFQAQWAEEGGIEGLTDSRIATLLQALHARCEMVGGAVELTMPAAV